MGMFTTIISPDGRSCQIKTGWDNCDTYKMGDKIPWKPSSLCPGKHIDGVYLGYGEHGRDTLVVIKDCTVAAVLPEFRSGDSLDIQIALLKVDYGLWPPDRSLWSEDAWAEKEARDKEMREKQEEWDREHAHLSLLEKMAAAVAEYLKWKMNEPSMARKVLTAIPKGGQMKVDVKKCERCGQDHDGLEFNKLISPALIDGEKYPYVGQCPATNEQVFMTIVSGTAAAPCPHAEAMTRVKEKGEQNGN